jgi:hypothetical protein
VLVSWLSMGDVDEHEEEDDRQFNAWRIKTECESFLVG